MHKLRLFFLPLAAVLFTVALAAQSSRYGVGSEELDPKQLGVAIYPGAQVDESEHTGKGTHLSLDWGQDSVHLFAQQYLTPDSPDKVLSFYRKQLAKYGNVLECRGNKPVVYVTSELKCEDSEEKRDDNSIELKAGTENNQHIVGVTPKDGGTKIGIVYLKKSGLK